MIIKKEDVWIKQEEMKRMSNGIPGVRRAQQGVIEYESIQHATARLDPVRREEENGQQHIRQEEPRVIEYKSIQRATARMDPVRKEEENEQRHTRQEQPGVWDTSQYSM